MYTSLNKVLSDSSGAFNGSVRPTATEVLSLPETYLDGLSNTVNYLCSKFYISSSFRSGVVLLCCGLRWNGTSYVPDTKHRNGHS